MGPLQGDRALLGGSEYGLVEILQNGACQKNIKNLFDPWCSQLYKDSSQLYYDPALYQRAAPARQLKAGRSRRSSVF